MGRPLRIEFSGAFYHVTSRGNEKRQIFLSEKDFRKFLDVLSELPARFAVEIHGFALLGNHYHLLLQTARPNLGMAMQYLNTSYAVYFNRMHKRVGHLLQGRYKAFLIEKNSYLLTVSRYIHLNPVKAHLVDRPEEHFWSSYRNYIGRGKRHSWVTCSMVLGQMSPDPSQAKKLYRKFVEDGLYLDENPFDSLKAGLVLGSEAFLEDLKRKCAVSKQPDVPQSKLFTDTPGLDHVLKVVSRYFQIDKDKIIHSYKQDNCARRACLYLLRTLTDLSSAEIGKKFHISYTAVSKATSRFRQEVKRDRKLHLLVNKCCRDLAGSALDT
jgi:putative transposase